MKIKILGDPHMGRRFTNSVPLHRRGDRERMMKDQFVQELDPKGAELHVCMGDLFDHPDVDLDTIWFVAQAYRKAAQDNKDTYYVVIRGNHDEHRDLDRVSAFTIFKGLVADVDNLIVVTDWHCWGEHVFFAWQPVQTAEGLVFEFAETDFDKDGMTAWGHWDVDLRSNPHNLIPTEALGQLGIRRAYTGHIHLPDEFVRDGVKVTVTGSMQPLAHGEGDMYVTLTKDELAKLDPATLKDKCVRIILKPGETYDVELDCLQLKYDREEEAEATAAEVTMEGFDLEKLFDETMVGVEASILEKVKERWQTTFTQQG